MLSLSDNIHESEGWLVNFVLNVHEKKYTTYKGRKQKCVCGPQEGSCPPPPQGCTRHSGRPRTHLRDKSQPRPPWSPGLAGASEMLDIACWVALVWGPEPPLARTSQSWVPSATPHNPGALMPTALCQGLGSCLGPWSLAICHCLPVPPSSVTLTMTAHTSLRPSGQPCASLPVSFLWALRLLICPHRGLEGPEGEWPLERAPPSD